VVRARVRAVRAVQSPPSLPSALLLLFPPCALRRQAPRWARGRVEGPGARSRTPPTSAPFAKEVGSKTRSRLFFSTSRPSQAVDEPGAACACGVWGLRVTGSWVLQLEVADWVSFGRLQLCRLRQKPPSRRKPDVKKRKRGLCRGRAFGSGTGG
jgi:hypothetical protein